MERSGAVLEPLFTVDAALSRAGIPRRSWPPAAATIAATVADERVRVTERLKDASAEA
jgi:hypothetical protein